MLDHVRAHAREGRRTPRERLAWLRDAARRRAVSGAWVGAVGVGLAALDLEAGYVLAAMAVPAALAAAIVMEVAALGARRGPRAARLVEVVVNAAWCLLAASLVGYVVVAWATATWPGGRPDWRLLVGATLLGCVVAVVAAVRAWRALGDRDHEAPPRPGPWGAA